MSLRTLPAASRRARPCAPSESDRVSAGRDAHQAVDCGQRSTGIERSSHPACSGLYVLSVISSRLHIAWVPLAFIPKSRRADKSVGRNGYRLGRCTNCHSWVRATSTRIKTGKVRGCETRTALYWAKRTKSEYLWLGEAVRNTDTRNIWYGRRIATSSQTMSSRSGVGTRLRQ
jgi:hypothetical protein